MASSTTPKPRPMKTLTSCRLCPATDPGVTASSTTPTTSATMQAAAMPMKMVQCWRAVLMGCSPGIIWGTADTSVGSRAVEHDQRRPGAEKRAIGYRVLEPSDAGDEQHHRNGTGQQHRRDHRIERAQVVAVEAQPGERPDQRTQLGVPLADGAAAEEQALHHEEEPHHGGAGEGAHEGEAGRPLRQAEGDHHPRVGDAVEDEAVLDVEGEHVDEDGHPEEMDGKTGAGRVVGGEGGEAGGGEHGAEVLLQPGHAVRLALPGLGLGSG